LVLLHVGRILALVAIMLPHVPFCVLFTWTPSTAAQTETPSKQLCPCCAGGNEDQSPPSTPQDGTPSPDCPAKLPCHYCASFNFTVPSLSPLLAAETVVFQGVTRTGLAHDVEGFPQGVERPPRLAC
jgi:hypothetical protein